jgi:Holliday junction resolvasome RuvABC endonuclease subunit
MENGNDVKKMDLGISLAQKNNIQQHILDLLNYEETEHRQK